MFSALLTDLSKAFDSLSRELIIAKHYPRGFDLKLLRLGFNYLSTRKQRVKFSNTCSSSSEISYDTGQKMKFSIKDCFGKCDQIRSFLRIWSHLLKKSLMETSFSV